ncbi:MAG: NAD(P)-dependent glycerol-3-phosphate dehydrogenase [Alphaproteobacteria bacterium]|nr:NAD(P)-dependent glycerol-3-phosphate dehydrogenase [Alphaproteobacteria bacterium]
MNRISVVGAGAWGTALALSGFRAGLAVKLWSSRLDKVETINQRRENIYRLPGIALDPQIQATTDLKGTADADVIILAPPAQYMRSTCEIFHKVWPTHVPLIIASKGIEDGSAILMSEIVRAYFPDNPLLILTGPSFASDVAKKLPTAIVLAAEDIAVAQKLAHLLSSSHFRLYACDDIIGAQIGGACKNIIAIACGIIAGLDLGDNARAALVTRGLAEVTRLGCAMGAKLETFLGLSGVGDMILTCLSSQSRNQAFGLALGRGAPLDELLSNKKTLVEGVHTVSGAVFLAKKLMVDMPITFAIYDLLNHGTPLEQLIDQLLSRPLKIERN